MSSNSQGRYMSDAEVKATFNSGATHVLEKFFGVSCAVRKEEAKEVLCSFFAKSADGAGDETRKYIISEKNTPEQNMEILKKALEQKRWYQTMRDERQAVVLSSPPADRDDESDFEISSVRDPEKEFELDLS